MAIRNLNKNIIIIKTHILQNDIFLYVGDSRFIYFYIIIFKINRKYFRQKNLAEETLKYSLLKIN